MGLFSKLLGLFGRPPAPANAAPAPAAHTPKRGPRNARVEDGMLTLRYPSFFGLAHRSPDKRWALGRFEGPANAPAGAVALVDMQSDQVAHVIKSFARPFDAAVANTGRYIVHDTGRNTAQLQGSVIAIDVDGSERYRRQYQANVYNIGISRCGRFAAVQTANAPDDDGNRLEVLDLERAATVFSVRPGASGWADSYGFDISKDGRLKALIAKHKGLGDFRFAADGQFLDGDSLQDARLESGASESRIEAARALLKADPSLQAARRALQVLHNALAAGDIPHGSSWLPLAHRVRGEALEIMGEPAQAVAAYEKALDLDPKAGVQRRLTALRKKLTRV